MSSDGVAQLTSKYHLICRLAVNTVHKIRNCIHSNISFDSLASKFNPWQNANHRLGYLVKDTSKGTSAEGPSSSTWTDLVRCYGSLTAVSQSAEALHLHTTRSNHGQRSIHLYLSIYRPRHSGLQISWQV